MVRDGDAVVTVCLAKVVGTVDAVVDALAHGLGVRGGRVGHPLTAVGTDLRSIRPDTTVDRVGNTGVALSEVSGEVAVRFVAVRIARRLVVAEHTSV